MKALAQEIVRKFSKRLNRLGIICRELTGDMQLTKVEIAETHIIVTTPEKWDIITRKSDEMVRIVKLLILDEVHLLHDDRGCVLEALVARTVRLVESAQTMIRIVGLSATLPNYVDVAAFLRAENGILYFDTRYRPVPLTQTFIGVYDNNSLRLRNSMDRVCFEKCRTSVKNGHQVMIFVHSRKATLNVARKMKEMFAENDEQHLCTQTSDDQKQFDFLKKRAAHKLGPDVYEIFLHGFGTHHAGMQRYSRIFVEKMFLQGYIKVLVCTATLAWGVNLPAHTVIINGTRVYDTKKGGFRNISMLDVLQIFGRAGRPQYDKVGGGEAYIITEHNNLNHYLSLLTKQLPIESQFHTDLSNHLNAEIVLGSVTNIDEAVNWLQYTYLYVRMLRNPKHYINVDDLLVSQQQQQQSLDSASYLLDVIYSAPLKKMIECAALELSKNKMARFDIGCNFYPTDMGRIASHYYIDCDTIGKWNKLIVNAKTIVDLLDIICNATEFQQMKMRDDEEHYLRRLRKDSCYYDIKSFEVKPDSPITKANILLQVHIGRQFYQLRHCSTLINDYNYVQKNAGRISRALYEICAKIGYSYLAEITLTLCKSIDLQVWHHSTPLRQFKQIKRELCMKIERANLKLNQMWVLSNTEIGRMLRDNKNARYVKQLSYIIPRVELDTNVRPISRNLLAIELLITPQFRWVQREHGSRLVFRIWVDDAMHNLIYHQEMYNMTDKDYREEEVLKVSMVLPIPENEDERPAQYRIHFVSNRWLGSHAMTTVSFEHLILPTMYPPETMLLDLHPLHISALQNPDLENVYRGRFEYFNAIQTQCFYVAFHTNNNILLGAPTGSGKTVVAELCVMRSFLKYPNKKIIYIAPLKALARERYYSWKEKFGKHSKLKKNIIMLTGDMTPDRRSINTAHVIITTPEKWDGISRYWKARSYVRKVACIIFDEIHLLGLDRGPILEVIVSRLKFVEHKQLRKESEKKTNDDFQSLRLIGLSTALANAEDLAEWLGVTHIGLYNFPAAQRPVPCQVHIQGYPGTHYCPRMQKMNKPVYAAIKTHSPNKPVLIFVASRRQTRLTAIDLISFVSRDRSANAPFLKIDHSEIQYVLKDVRDDNLRHTLAFGIGLHHAGLHPSDRKVVERLFLSNSIQVLVATSTLAWGVNLPAHLVVIKGTEYFDAKTKKWLQFPVTDILQMIGRAGRPQFDTHAVALVLVQQSKKNFYKKFLYQSFPVESSLHEDMHDHINAEIAVKTLSSIQDCVEYLMWTFLFRRILKNPTYYQLEDVSAEGVNKYLRDLMRSVLWDLSDSGCIKFLETNDETMSDSFEPTTAGQIASYFYLKYQTMNVFKTDLVADCTLNDLLRILCSTREYDDLPVRHNEEKLNALLAELVPWSVSDLPMDEPATKAVLLFQAHFSRLELPIADYVTDTRSVLDQAKRILQAMVDYAVYHEWLDCCLQIINLAQMVTQGRWLNDSTLANLPGITEQAIIDLWNDAGIESLPELMKYSVSGSSFAKIERILEKCLEKEIVDDIFQHLKYIYPRIAVRVTLSRFESSLDSDLMVIVKMRRFSGDPQKIYSPRWAKATMEGWFIIIAVRGTKKLLALKRVRIEKKWKTYRINIHIPDKSELQESELDVENIKSLVFDVYLMSDGYLGLDQFYTISCTIDDTVNDMKADDPLCNIHMLRNDLMLETKTAEIESDMISNTNTNMGASVLSSGLTYDMSGQILGGITEDYVYDGTNSVAMTTATNISNFSDIDFGELRNALQLYGDNETSASVLDQSSIAQTWD